ncbi:SRSF protein kinase 2 isoform X5 [Oncorhynchus mykiss]|uniref:SRSF protein kinase 2 isoform X5 n=1 Tax=Oncorhynchus mykiss TaxID=8022 RepID=UPI001878406C|nr:SRSF protein kinase 2 isoform X5 [Oncorhynchus mykiss]
MERNMCSAQTSVQLAQKTKPGTSNGLDKLNRLEQLEPEESLDREDPREYCHGGYHPVHIGDTFNRRYQVLSKLGWGYFSTVWLCLDLRFIHYVAVLCMCRLGRRVAVKVLKSGEGFTQAGQDELTLLRCASGPTVRHLQSRRIVQLLDEFKIAGVNGVHVCLVLELLGPDLRCWQVCFGNPGLSLSWVKQVIAQVLQALDYLHTQCKIIHTDIKPENILLCLEEQNPKQTAGGSACPYPGKDAKSRSTAEKDLVTPISLKKITVKIADLGSSCWVAFELVTGDSLFEPKAGKTFSLEEDHIAHIIELLGKVPAAVALSGKNSMEYFNSKGDMRHIGVMRPWGLYEVLVEKYHFMLKEASLFSDFLLHMLDFQPERRASAAQCLLHPWLSS